MIDVRDRFPGVADCIYLNTASMALGNQPAVDALNAALDEWAVGAFDWVAAESIGEQLRNAVASLLGASVDNLALVSGAAGGAATVASQLRAHGPGANIVVPARDFASNLLPWLLLQDRGYELRLVEDSGGVLSVDSFAALVDSRTRVIATSLVQSASGFRVDLEGLRSVAATAGAWLVLDASQALGSVSVDVEGVAAVFSCSHKWTLGTRGIGYLYVDSDLLGDFVPVTPGWKATADPMKSFYGPAISLSSTASKLDTSWPWFNPIADIEGIRIIEEVGVAAVEAHNLDLINHLEELGFPLPFAVGSRSAITSIALDHPEAARDALARENVIASVRAGRLRISVHIYNTHEDIEHLAEILRRT